MPTIKEQCENRIRELVPDLRVKTDINEPKNNIYATIHLEHILLAIEKVGNNNYYVWSNGFFCKEGKDQQGKMMECEEYYELSKPFSDQSEDFYAFLLEIIK